MILLAAARWAAPNTKAAHMRPFFLGEGGAARRVGETPAGGCPSPRREKFFSRFARSRSINLYKSWIERKAKRIRPEKQPKKREESSCCKIDPLGGITGESVFSGDPLGGITYAYPTLWAESPIRGHALPKI